ncbi:10191_t:CDS:2 [Scutellospora calospora]|uniref:10191_t:CDS:1 n=1 Tax=Scutellospora calospora TaxID=85575 RepID=A0ACA9L3V1_9GLOM|nr:10191_t:CDS:2 [Scutellospora calospora]
MLREFHQEIEEYLKKEFPTSKVESNGNDKNWTVAISNFIDARKALYPIPEGEDTPLNN